MPIKPIRMLEEFKDENFDDFTSQEYKDNEYLMDTFELNVGDDVVVFDTGIFGARLVGINVKEDKYLVYYEEIGNYLVYPRSKIGKTI